MDSSNLKDLLKSDLQARLTIIREKAIEIWSSPRHRFFTDHSPSGHSERVIGYLNAVVEDLMKTDKALNQHEIFILLSSAYLHDIGMQYDKDPKLDLFQTRDVHHLLSENMIIGSVNDPRNYPNLSLSPEYVDEIAKVSKGHTKIDLRSPAYDTINKAGQDIRLRLLAALLRLADALDIDYRRVILENLKLSSVPQDSRIHWWKCHFVEGIKIENGKIDIYYKFPSTVEPQRYDRFVKASIENQVDEEVKQLTDILWPLGIKLYLGKGHIEYSETKEKMSEYDLKVLSENQLQNETMRLKQNEAKVRDAQRWHEEQEIRELLSRAKEMEEKGCHDLQARALEELGDKLNKKGQSFSALHYYTRSAELYKGLNDFNGAFRVIDKKGTIRLIYLQGQFAYGDFEECLKYATSLNDEALIARSRLNLGKSLYVDFLLQDAEKNFLQALELFEKLKNFSQQVEALQSLAKIKIDEGNLGEAEEYLGRCAKLLDGTKQVEDKVSINNQLGRVYSEKSEWEKAEKIFRLNLTSLDSSVEGHATLILETYEELAENSLRKGEINEAASYFDECLKILDRIGDERTKANIYRNLYLVKYLGGLRTAAFEDWTTSVDIEHKLENVYDRARLYEYYGLVGLTEGNFPEARLNFLKSLSLYTTTHNLQGVHYIYRNLGDLYAVTGFYKEALKYFVKLGEDKKLKQVCDAIKSARASKVDIRTLFQELLSNGLTVEERTGTARVLGMLADIAPEELVGSIASLLLKLCNEEYNFISERNVRGASIEALSEYADRLPDDAVYEVVRRFLDMTNDREAWTVRRSALVGLERARSLIDPSIHGQVTDHLIELTKNKNWMIQDQARRTMVNFAIFAEAKSKQRIVVHLRKMLEDSDEVAASYLAFLDAPIEEQIVEKIIDKFISELNAQVQKDEQGKIKISMGRGTSLLWHLKKYIPIKKRSDLIASLLQTAMNKQNMIVNRTDAILTIGELGEIIPESELDKVVLFLIQIARGDFEISEHDQWIIGFSAHPFSRARADMGSPDDLISYACLALATINERIPPNLRKEVISVLIDNTKHSSVTIRENAILSLGLCGNLIEPPSKVIQRLHIALYDNVDIIRSRSCQAIGRLWNFPSSDELKDILERLLVLSSDTSYKVRIAVAFALKNLQNRKDLGDLSSRSIKETLKILSEDISFQVRKEVAFKDLYRA